MSTSRLPHASRPELALPAGWWGPVWAAARPRTLGELIGEGVLSAETAALLWIWVERGGSLTVAAGPSGAGKTTVLTSLLEALPPERARYPVHGIHEPFVSLPPAGSGAALLVNEISPHMPIYAWGPVVRRLLDLGRGYQILATIHARQIEEIVAQLAGYPLRIPVEAIAALGAVAFLDAWDDGMRVRRRLERVERLTVDPASGGLRASPLTAGEIGDEAVAQLAATLARRAGDGETDRAS